MFLSVSHDEKSVDLLLLEFQVGSNSNSSYFCLFSEDNNTRVLFERVLTSGNLEPEKSV